MQHQKNNGRRGLGLLLYQVWEVKTPNKELVGTLFVWFNMFELFSQINVLPRQALLALVVVDFKLFRAASLFFFSAALFKTPGACRALTVGRFFSRAKSWRIVILHSSLSLSSQQPIRVQEWRGKFHTEQLSFCYKDVSTSAKSRKMEEKLILLVSEHTEHFSQKQIIYQIR